MKHEENRLTAKLLLFAFLAVLAAASCYVICVVNFFHTPHLSLDGENFRLSFSKYPAMRTAGFGLGGYLGTKAIPWQIRCRFRSMRLPFQRVLFNH